MKDILVAATGSPADEIRFSVASTLAERHGAALSVLMANAISVASMPGTVVPGIGAGAIPMPMPEAEPSPAAETLQSETEARFADRPDVRLMRIDDTVTGIQDRTVQLCRTKDLFVTSLPSAEDGMLTNLFDAVLADRATPVLALPEETDPVPMFRQVCVAWSGGAECARAVHHAMPILQLAEKVLIITVDQHRAAGDETIDKTEIERHLEANGIAAELLPVASGQMKTAGAILAEASRVGADLLVAGAHDPSGLFAWFSSSVSQDLIRKGSVPLLLAR